MRHKTLKNKDKTDTDKEKERQRERDKERERERERRYIVKQMHTCMKRKKQRQDKVESG